MAKAVPTITDAYQLLHHGTLVMSEMEANGIHVDTAYIEQAQQKIQQRIDELTKELEQDKIFARWKKAFGSKTKLGSRSQLAHVLFTIMNIPTESKTSTRYAADADVLEDVNLPFTKKYIECEKLKKAKNTYLANILRETVDGVIHPNFDLNTARTYRSSSSNPNFQNIPMRDPLVKELIRKAFVARKGRCIVDLDFKGSEVNAAAWYHKDPKMLEYIKTDPGRMHLDAAMQIYKLSEKQMTPEIRHCGKNMFVFPQFYGDWWLSCAKQLWKAIHRLNLKTADGIPLDVWLKKRGIHSLGTGDPDNIDPNSFEAHVKAVENDFWNRRFRVYQRWKENWWRAYQNKGYFDMLTGFRITGYLDRKKCINWPIQGCLAGSCRVLTDKGQIPIRELVGVHTRVWTGIRWADAVGLDRGICKRATIQLKSGRTIECDIRHELKNERGEWVTFSDLQIGDFVALPKITTPGENEEIPEEYCYDRIAKIVVQDKVETTYTMSVNDPLHQFVAEGVIHKNTAFHCLLWSVIQISKLLKKNKMKTKLVGQIHDDVVADVPKNELKDYIDMCNDVVTNQLKQHWPWIITPMRIEVEVTPVNGSWYEKRPYKA